MTELDETKCGLDLDLTDMLIISIKMMTPLKTFYSRKPNEKLDQPTCV